MTQPVRAAAAVFLGLLLVVITRAAPTGAIGGKKDSEESAGQVKPVKRDISDGRSMAAVWSWRLLIVLTGLAAAAAALIKAGYAPIAASPRQAVTQTQPGGKNVALIGLACAALGVVFLLRGYVFYGLLTNLAIIAAGLYVTLDWLVARNIVTPELAAKSRPMGVPIGLACAALAIISLLCALLGIPLYVI
jgi:hypothetical protein